MHANLDQKKESPRILDLACGTGEHIRHLGDALPKASIEGVDINTGSVNLARDKFKKNNNISIAVDEMSNFLRSTDKQYDLITCFFASLQYITNPSDLRSLIKNIYSHLLPGATFIFDLRYAYEHWQDSQIVASTYHDENIDISLVGMPFANGKFVSWNPSITWKERGHIDMFVDEHSIYLYSIDDLNDYLNDAGFTAKIYNGFSKTKYTGKEPPLFIARKTEFLK